MRVLLLLSFSSVFLFSQARLSAGGGEGGGRIVGGEEEEEEEDCKRVDGCVLTDEEGEQPVI